MMRINKASFNVNMELVLIPSFIPWQVAGQALFVADIVERDKHHDHM
jgi:hypothetical protein